MAEIKNLWYQPLPITDSKKVTVILKGREKRDFPNIDAENLPEGLKALKNKGYIKIK